MTRELMQQFTLRISRANKTQMIVILYEMLLIYIEESKEAHAQGDRAAFKEGIRKARGCVKELMESLHLEYEVAENLLQLYLYIRQELTRADIHNRTEELDHIKRVVEKLCGAYNEISKQDTSDPVMENTQVVYAGLTYGKNTLTENLTDQGSSRGFRA